MWAGSSANSPEHIANTCQPHSIYCLKQRFLLNSITQQWREKLAQGGERAVSSIIHVQHDFAVCMPDEMQVHPCIRALGALALEAQWTINQQTDILSELFRRFLSTPQPSTPYSQYVLVPEGWAYIPATSKITTQHKAMRTEPLVKCRGRHFCSRSTRDKGGGKARKAGKHREKQGAG